MFLICDREKITSYIILLSTVFILFGVAVNLRNKNNQKSAVTSAQAGINTTSNIIKNHNTNEEYED